MSGRHKMPPAGRRKGTADAGESPEQTSPEPETVEDTAVEDTAVEDTAVEDTAVAAGAVAVPAETSVEEPGETVEDEADEAVEESVDADETADAEEPSEPAATPRTRRRASLPVVLAAIALVLAFASALLRWQIVAHHQSDTARAESVAVAKEITTQMLSYETESVQEQLTAVRDRLTGNFLGKYTAMINEIIPAAQAQQIAAVADVPKVGAVSATPDSAEVVLFVNQAVAVGNNMPQRTLSVVRATMVKKGDRWLMSEYEPVQP